MDSIGSAPYVEPSSNSIKHNVLARENIRLVLDIAQAHTLHADFHLDYNLDTAQVPLVWYLVHEVRTRIREGLWRRGKHICVGHATRLALFSHGEWSRLVDLIVQDDLPITFVGLPQSDLYMMGRGSPSLADSASPAIPLNPRGTLNPVRLKDEYGLDIALSVNNVENPFTPQGFADPLGLGTLGVAVWQSGTKSACTTLLGSRKLFICRDRADIQGRRL